MMNVIGNRIVILFCALLAIGVTHGFVEQKKYERKVVIDIGRFIDKSGVCKENGFKRNETDNSQFYRCVDFYGNGETFIIFQFKCPLTLEFDQEISVCTEPVKPNDAPVAIKRPMNGPIATITSTNNQESTATLLLSTSQFTEAFTSKPPLIDTLSVPTTSATLWTDFLVEPSTVAPTTPSLFVNNPVESSATPTLSLQEVENTEVSTEDIYKMKCTSDTLYRLPNDCTRFYQCYQRSISIFSCAPGLVFDENISRCVLPDETTCIDQKIRPLGDEFEGNFEIDCSGLLQRYPFDCRRFYQCYNDGQSKSLLFYSCSDGLVFDERSNKCLLPYETYPCHADESPFKSSPLMYHLQRLYHSSADNKFSLSLK